MNSELITAKEYFTSNGNKLGYYLLDEGDRIIVMLHAQDTSSESCFEAAEHLAR